MANLEVVQCAWVIYKRGTREEHFGGKNCFLSKEI